MRWGALKYQSICLRYVLNLHSYGSSFIELTDLGMTMTPSIAQTAVHATWRRGGASLTTDKRPTSYCCGRIRGLPAGRDRLLHPEQNTRALGQSLSQR